MNPFRFSILVGALCALVSGCDDSASNTTHDAADLGVQLDASSLPVCGTFCTLESEPCLGGVWDCSDSTPVCGPRFSIPAGTVCGDNATCDGLGACVVRDVTDAGVGDASMSDTGAAVQDAATDARSTIEGDCDSFAVISSSDDVATYEACTSLRALLINADVSLPNLENVTGPVVIGAGATTISLPHLRAIGDLNVDSTRLETFSLPALEFTTGQIYIYNNAMLESLNLPLLAAVGGTIEITQNGLLTEVTLPLLAFVRWDFYLQFNATLESLSLPALRTASGLSIYRNDVLSSVVLNRLENIRYLSLQDNALLTTFDFTTVSVVRDLYIDTMSLTTIDLSTFANLVNLTIQRAPAFESLDAHLVETLRDVRVSECAALTELNLSALTAVNGSVNITANPMLASLSLASLETVSGDFVLAETAVTACDLSSLVSVGGLLTIANHPAVTSLDLTSLESSSTLFVYGNASLTTFSLNNAVRVPSSAAEGHVTEGGINSNAMLCEIMTTASVTTFSLGSSCP